jgi:bifunctional UDP-N-acetylglucosamine pyrophosphorylase/glucosamine-1-phosphate N-acetyltransferase
MNAAGWLSGFTGSLLVLVGDAPFITSQILAQLIKKQQDGDLAVCFLTTIFDVPPPWGRVVRDKDGKIIRLVEEKDASADEKKIREVSSSHYVFNWPKLEWALQTIDSRNAQGEFYLPDVIEKFLVKGWPVETETITDTLPSFGINSEKDLLFATQEMEKLKFLHD